MPGPSPRARGDRGCDWWRRSGSVPGRDDPPPAGVPLEVRRRRTLFVVMAGLLLALALPLSGAGGHSHPTGSARAEPVAPGVYTVQPGDSLWTIAERLEPSADPRPLVVQLAAQTGSETVVPGEKIDLP